MGDEDETPTSSQETDLVPSEESLGTEIEKQFYNPLDHISPKQQKFVELQITTNMDTGQIATSLGLSAYKRRKWEKDDHVQAYLKQCQKRYSDSNMIETARKQRRLIRERFFMEFLDRMRDPDQAAEEKFEGQDVSIERMIQYKERFMSAASFKDFARIWDKIEKQTRLDGGEATERVDDGAIETRARKKFARYKERRRKTKDLKNEAEKAIEDGETFEEFQARVNRGQEDEPELVEADEDEEWETETEIEMEEWEITKG